MSVFSRASAQDKTLLSSLEITHVVNAADGRGHIDTGPCFYKDTNIMYHGIEAPDCRAFDLSPFFTETADFIHTALSGKGERSKQNCMVKMYYGAGKADYIKHMQRSD